MTDLKRTPSGADKPSIFGDLVKAIVKKAKPSKQALKGRRLAAVILSKELGAQSGMADVASVKTGVVTIETNSPPFFQELEGYRKKQLIEAFRAGGLQVRELRVRLAAL